MIMNGKKVIRNSILPIIRITETDKKGNRSLLGTIKLSNMLPVPLAVLHDYDLDNEIEIDTDYKDLVLKEKRFINRYEEVIVSYAEALYKEKTEGLSKRGYLSSTFDFVKFENYIKDHYTLP